MVRALLHRDVAAPGPLPGHHVRCHQPRRRHRRGKARPVRVRPRRPARAPKGMA